MAKAYIATEDTQSDIKNLVAGISTKMGSDGFGGCLPHITVQAPTGSTVTAANGTTVLTAEEVNGVYQFNLPHLGDWVVATAKNGRTNTRTVSVTDVREYKINTSYGYRYGYRIKKSEGNPAARVEYLFDAVGLAPAKMDYTNGVFDFGGWADKWFVRDNKPLMLKSNGEVDYYLDPNYYARKEDGTASDVGNTAYDGNAMAQIPLCYVKRYEDDDYLYEIISDVQYDEDYKAYAHTRADGSIADVFYWSMFGSGGGASKIRSLADQTLVQSLTAQQEIDGCKANGAKWYTHSWSQRELIRTLLILMGKSTNTQSVFGNGNCRSASSASGLLTTGTLKDKGQFYGYNDSTHQVKVFHIEGFWGDQWDRTAGVINSGGKIYVKMTPEGQGYRVTDTDGYTDTGVTLTGSSGGYISEATCSENGIIPKTISGSATTYYCDGAWFNNSVLCYLLAGASAGNTTAIGGAFTFAVDAAPAHAYWHNGCGLSCEKPVAA